MAHAPTAQAAGCSNPSHQPYLTKGAVTPGTGTTTTSFTFSVTYRDSKGCAPTIASVQISGVGSFGLAGSGNYAGGVKFSRKMTLPAGTHTYLFAFTSGTGGGVKSVKLTTVSPAKVVVTAPAPPPPPPPTATPVPTRKPAPKPPAPTPAPPKATPAPRPTATPGSTATPAVSATASPSAPASAAESPADDRMSGWEMGMAGLIHGGPPGSGSSNSPFDPLGLGTSRIAVWVATTAGGVALFLLLMRQRRSDEELPMHEQLALPEAPQHVFTQHAAAPDVPPDEVNLPRWLRPSVQAARGRRRS